MKPEILANEERGKGPALLFVHGFPLHAGMWKAQVAGLPKHATCYTVDLRGHGMSSELPVEGATIDLFADDIAATLDELGVDKVDLAGLSMGGYVVFSFWRRHRDRVRSLILVDTKAEADNDDAKKGRAATAELVRAEGMAPLWEKLKGVMFCDSPSEDALAATEAIAMSISPETAAAVALAMGTRADATELLSSIDVPVTWIHGTQDKLMPIDQAEVTVKQFPNARLAPIDNAGHLAPIEQPDAVNEAIIAHLQWARG